MRLVSELPRLNPRSKSFQELKYYITQNASFRGPLNYYRTTRIRFDEEKGEPTCDVKIYSQRGLTLLEIPAGDLPMTYAVEIPVIFLRGTADSTSPEVAVGLIEKLLPQTKVINYEGSGHWLMYQEKENVVKDILSWLLDSNLSKL